MEGDFPIIGSAARHPCCEVRRKPAATWADREGPESEKGIPQDEPRTGVIQAAAASPALSPAYSATGSLPKPSATGIRQLVWRTSIAQQHLQPRPISARWRLQNHGDHPGDTHPLGECYHHGSSAKAFPRSSSAINTPFETPFGTRNAGAAEVQPLTTPVSRPTSPKGSKLTPRFYLMKSATADDPRPRGRFFRAGNSAVPARRMEGSASAFRARVAIPSFSYWNQLQRPRFFSPGSHAVVCVQGARHAGKLSSSEAAMIITGRGAAMARSSWLFA